MTSLLGGGLGLAGAWVGLRVLAVVLPADLPGLRALSLNTTVLAFTGGVSVLTALFCGISPAIQALRQDSSSALSMRPWMVTRSGHRLRSSFVVGQLALALVLSICAGLMPSLCQYE